MNQALFSSLVESEIKSLLAAQKLAGVGIGVVMQGQLIFCNSYGMADIARGVPWRSDTICKAASMTKAMTVTCAMQLVEQNMLRLEDDVSTYIPSFANLEVWIAHDVSGISS